MNFIFQITFRTLYEQSDIATSLSIVLGLPIPKSSIGTVITHFIRDFDKESKLYAYYYNALHLFDKIKNVFDDDVLRNKGDTFFMFTEPNSITYLIQILFLQNFSFNSKRPKLSIKSF